MGGGKRQTAIVNINDIIRNQYTVIITIADVEQAIKVKDELTSKGVVITTVEEVLYPNKDIIDRNRQYIAQFHEKVMDDYYANSEAEKLLEIFWQENSIFRQTFKKLDVKKVVELACGRGRHVPQYLSDAQEIMLVDILERNISFCKERFAKESKIQYYVNNGNDLSALKTEEYTALFTYDAMVHFEMLDIFQYLKETSRILVRGGRGLFHHSNNTSDYRITFSTGAGGRNYMSKQLFAYLANRAGLVVLDQYTIDWSGRKNLDCLTLVEKP